MCLLPFVQPSSLQTWRLIFTCKALLAYCFILYIILHLCALQLMFSDIFVLSPIASLVFRSCFSWKYMPLYCFVIFPYLLTSILALSISFSYTYIASSGVFWFLHSAASKMSHLTKAVLLGTSLLCCMNTSTVQNCLLLKLRHGVTKAKKFSGNIKLRKVKGPEKVRQSNVGWE